MKNNFKVNKSYINYIHARDFFPKGEAETALGWIKALDKFTELTPYGNEIPNIHLVFPDMEMIVGGMLGDWVKIDLEDSGTFRTPLHNQIIFEDYYDENEWRLAVAMEDNVFKTYNHISGAKDSRDDYKFNYSNPEDWQVETIINLKQNDAVFYRPWLFHSFEDKIIHHHKIYVQEE